MPEHRTPAVVLHHQDFGETDRIVTFYTRDYGKVKGIAKGARKSRKRFGPALDLFSYVALGFFSKETLSLVRVEHCQLRQAFPRLQEDLTRLGFGSYIAELINEMTVEGVSHPDLFETLIYFFTLFDTLDPREDYLRIFEMRILNTLGYRPCLDRCTACKSDLQRGQVFRFSIAGGGVVCEACAPGGRNLYPVSLGTAKLLDQACKLRCDKTQRLVFSLQALEESREFLPRFIQFHLGKELRTMKFLEKCGNSVFKGTLS